LKILCVIESGTWVDSHIVGSLRAGGHDVHVFHYGFAVGEYYGRSRRQERARGNEQLLETAKALCRDPGLELVFCYVYDDFLQEDTAEELSALDVPMVNYNVDMVNQWYRQTRTARYFTRMLCAQRANMRQLARYNPSVLHFPMAASVVSGSQASSTLAPAAPVTFVGTPMPCRERVLARLNRDGIPLAIYGKYWQERRHASAPASREKIFDDLRHYAIPKFRAEGLAGLGRALGRRLRPSPETMANGLPPDLLHGFLPSEELHSLFARSAINLGFTRMSGDDPDTPGITQIKLRDFEVPIAGGFYLVERAPEYDEFFRPGVDVETWESPAELVDKIRYYLAHDGERRRIAAAGRRGAEAEHTWDHRFRTLFADLGIGA